MTERHRNFTGKSDFFDWCNMHNKPEEVLTKAKVYLGDAKIELKKPEDLIPYYTHLVASAACNGSSQTINLTRKSYINIEEAEHIGNLVYDAIYWYRKAKREKVPFNYAFAQRQKNFWCSEKPVMESIIAIINKNPNITKFHLDSDYRKALEFITEYIIPHYFSKVHDAMHTRQREDFVKYASENGYCAFSWNFETGEVGYQNQGEWHPAIRDMCFDIADYHKMMKEGKVS